MLYSANSREDLDKLADTLESIPDGPWKTNLVVRCFADGLMTFPWHIRLLMLPGVIRKGEEKVCKEYFSLMEKHCPGHTEKVFQQIIFHMLYGEDVEDEDSIGGFSQGELNKFVSYIPIQGVR